MAEFSKGFVGTLGSLCAVAGAGGLPSRALGGVERELSKELVGAGSAPVGAANEEKSTVGASLAGSENGDPVFAFSTVASAGGVLEAGNFEGWRLQGGWLERRSVESGRF